MQYHHAPIYGILPMTDGQENCTWNQYQNNGTGFWYHRKFDRGLGQILHEELHWLDVPDRAIFKLAVIVHRCLNGRTPPYLSDYCTPDASADQRHLRTTNCQLLTVPRYRLNTYGRRAFSVAGPSLELIPEFHPGPDHQFGLFQKFTCHMESNSVTCHPVAVTFHLYHSQSWYST